MSDSRIEIRFQVLNLTDPGKAAMVEPGFYYLIPLEHLGLQDLPEDHSIGLEGPYPTHEAASQAARDWIIKTLFTPEEELPLAA